MKDSDASVPAKYKRRPGPFGPAWAFLPKGQQPLVLDGATPASEALERVVDTGFSQVPVKDKTGGIIGVFSWISFGKRVADLHATKIKPTELPIREAMEPARFIGPEEGTVRGHSIVGRQGVQCFGVGRRLQSGCAPGEVAAVGGGMQRVTMAARDDTEKAPVRSPPFPWVLGAFWGQDWQR